MTDPIGAKRRANQAAQIAVLGLVWVTGVVALVFEDRGAEQGRRDQAAAGATGRATPPVTAQTAPPETSTAETETATAETETATAETETPDCLLTAAAGSIQVWGGTLGCDGPGEEHFRFVWNERQARLLFPERRLSLKVDPRARRQFVAALVEAARGPASVGGGCSVLRSVDLDWSCGAGTTMHAAFRDSRCPRLGDAAGPIDRVHQALSGLFLRSATVSPTAP